jgi:hypothetical protein
VSYLTGINWLPNSRTAAAETAEEDNQTQQKALEPFTNEQLADFKERIRSADAAVEANTGQWVKMCEQRTPEIDYVAHRNILKVRSLCVRWRLFRGELRAFPAKLLESLQNFLF